MSIFERCSRQIERVTVLRAAYVAADIATGRAGVHPATLVMTAAIEAAHKALGDGDAISIIKAVHLLEAFEP